VGFLERIKEIPITDYAERIGFTLVRKGNFYSLKEHDSVIIDTQKNCFWRNSTFVKGLKGAGSIIDFAIEFKGYSDVKTAMRSIAGIYGIKGDKPSNVMYNSFQKLELRHSKNTDKVESEIAELKLPRAAIDNKKVYHYLNKERCIDLTVLRYMFAKKMIYQDIHNNCVFVSYKFACIRSTSGNFVGDVPGCDYNECFYLKCSSRADTLVVTESVIDSMSVMTYFIKNDRRYTDYCYLALCGVNKLSSLYYHIGNDSSIRNIILALDNDEAGRNATETAITGLNNRGFNSTVSILQPLIWKDWNEAIQRLYAEK